MIKFAIVGFRMYSSNERESVAPDGTKGYGFNVFADVTIDAAGLGVVEKSEIRLAPDAIEEIKAILRRSIANEE